jgi:hypothetical protein
MRNVVLATAIVCGLVANFGVSGASAAVIDTFDFTQVGWTLASIFDATVSTSGSPDPGGVLTGSFTGTVEPSGLIELSDLTAFTETYTDTADPGGVVSQNLTDTTLFSYNTAGGASSLDIAGEIAPGVCVGASVSLDSNCTANFVISYTPGIDGAAYLGNGGLPKFVTSDQPTLTLVFQRLGLSARAADQRPFSYGPNRNARLHRVDSAPPSFERQGLAPIV